MDEQYTHKISVEMRLLDESSKRELAAYRKLGSLKEIRVLKYKESQRIQRKRKILEFIDKLVAGVLFMTIIFALLCIAVACA